MTQSVSWSTTRLSLAAKQRRRVAWSLVAPAIVLCAGMLAAQPHDPLKLGISIDDETPVRADGRLELVLSRALGPTEGRLGVFLDRIDLTSLFVHDGLTLAYRSDVKPLPTGPGTLTVYLVSPDEEWLEIATLPLVVEAPPVASPGQAETLRREWARELAPSLTVSIKGQRTVDYSPEEARPPRGDAHDASLQAGLSAGASSGSFTSQGQLDVVGVSYRPESLRYGELGEEAPRVDLSSYLVQLGTGGFKLYLGHTSFGTHRHLVSDFSSRGLVATSAIGSQLDVSVAALNGTSIVGWSNPFGLETREHRVLSGTVGLELVPGRPGGARIEVNAVDGSLQPTSSYTQSHLSDAEQSQGLGARLLASDAQQRFRIEAGYARSSFENPSDPLLDQGAGTVAVQAVTRDAYFLDADLQVLRELRLAEGWASNVTLALRHSRIDPLYRSVAVYTQADRQSSQLQVSGNVGEIKLAASHERGNDNLDDVASILKSFTRRTSGQLILPLGALGAPAGPRSSLLPQITLAWQSTHQFADALPSNGDFDPSAVPDQVSTNSTVSADWQLPTWRVGCRWNSSFQDNRQPGRELDDIENSVTGIALALTVATGLDVIVDLSSERARNHATEARYEILRGTLAVTIKTSRRSVLALSGGTTSEGDVAGSSRSRNLDADAQWSTGFGAKEPGRLGLEGQLFIRYALRTASSYDTVFLLDSENQVQSVNGGVRITLF